MSRFLHVLGHAALIGLNLVVAYYHLVPGRYAPLAVAVGGLAQAVLALVNHDPVNR